MPWGAEERTHRECWDTRAAAHPLPVTARIKVWLDDDPCPRRTHPGGAMSLDPTMRSRPAEEYPGRYWSVDAADLVAQRAKGWPDFHPEDFCHRCGHPNVSWHIDSDVWNPVMRGGAPEGWGDWQEIICIPCFMELAEGHYGACTWRIVREAGTFTETLILASAGV